MAFDFRMPQITGSTEKEQLEQIKSYLIQFIPQLQWALNTIDTTGASGYISPVPKRTTQSTASIDSEVAFNTLKPLIIKSADIVNAYYQEISKRLDGIYVAESDFGTFAEQTSQDIQANSAAITQNFNNTQVIIQTEIEALNTEMKEYSDSHASTLGEQINEAATDLEGKIAEVNARVDDANVTIEDIGIALDDTKARIDNTEGVLETAKTDMTEAIQKVSESLSETDKLLEGTRQHLEGSLDDLEFTLSGLEQLILGVTAYIRSGVLYYTDGGVPVYGVEIGQEVESNGENVFKKFSRFTSEKLSFYDSNDNEVAYISDKKLYIGQAQITISLQVGGFIQLVRPNGDVVEKWIGG